MSPRNNRRQSLAALLAAAAFAGVAPDAQAGSKVWMGQWGSWGDSAMWSPSGVPGSGDAVSIGSSIVSFNSTVSLDINPTIASLSLTDGMGLRTQYHQLTVTGNTVISGDNGPVGGYTTDLTVFHGFGNPWDFRTNNLTISDGARMIADRAIVDVMGSMLVDGASNIYSGGTINFYGNTGPVLTLDGGLYFGHFGSNPYWAWTLNQFGSGRIDLDGGVAGDNYIDISNADYSFTINGDALYDTYDDSFTLARGAELNMNLTNGWTLGPTGWLSFYKTIEDGISRVTGGTLTCNGTISLGGGDNVVAHIEAPVHMTSSSKIVVDLGDSLIFQEPVTFAGMSTLYSDALLQCNDTATINGGTIELKILGALAEFNGTTTINAGYMRVGLESGIDFNAPTTVNGGTMSLAEGGTIDFNGSTTINGGAFEAFGPDPSDGQVRFNGATRFANTIKMTGLVRQNGNATVDNPATINADVFDMDGELGTTVWNINAPLTINADAIDTGDSQFDGVMNIISTVAQPAGLAINLPAGQAWSSTGTVSLVGAGFGTNTNVIAGSDVNFFGRLNVSFDNAISARATFKAGSITNINSSSSLRLDGGTLGAMNSITGGTIQGAGTLKSSAGHGLWGFGTIATSVAFATGELRADGGTLNVNGAVTSVGVIGAQPTGTLKFALPFNTSVATRLDLSGGTVTGATITNTKETRGFGSITTSAFVNNGSINVTGGTLVINTTASPDLDGTTETGALLVAGGDLVVVNAPADTFNGIATISQNRTMELQGGWTLGAGGTLNLQGNLLIPSTVRAPSQTIAGNVTMPPGGVGRFDAKTTFASGASVQLAQPNNQIELLQDGTVNTGAVITGTGTLKNTSGARLRLLHGSVVDARVENSGTLDIGSMFGGQTTVRKLALNASGTLVEDMMGATPGTLFDRIDATETVTLGGAMTINPGFYSPAYLVPHEIIHTNGGVSGQFATITGIALSPTKYLAVTTDFDSVLVTAAIPGDANLDGTVSGSDFNILATNFGAGGKSWASADFNGDGSSNSADFNLLASNFGTSIPSGPGAAVPEPGALSCLVVSAGMLLRVRRRSATSS